MNIYKNKSKAELIDLKSKLENDIKIINSELQNLKWIEHQENIKKLTNIIDKNDYNQILYTEILTLRFMLFDVSESMRELRKKLLPKSIKPGYSLRQIGAAFEFYNKKLKEIGI